MSSLGSLPLPVSPDNDPLRDPSLYINRELSQLEIGRASCRERV